MSSFMRDGFVLLNETFNESTAKALGLDAKSLEGIYTIYWNNAIQEITEIERALASGDSEKLRTVAHSLKGASRTLGADKLSSLAELIELSVKKGQDIEEPQLVEILKENLQSFKAAIHESNLLI